MSLALRWSADETVIADAFRIAVAVDRPIYDCVYLALAPRFDARLVTADFRFVGAVEATEHSGALIALASRATDR